MSACFSNLNMQCSVRGSVSLHIPFILDAPTCQRSWLQCFCFLRKWFEMGVMVRLISAYVELSRPTAHGLSPDTRNHLMVTHTPNEVISVSLSLIYMQQSRLLIQGGEKYWWVFSVVFMYVWHCSQNGCLQIKSTCTHDSWSVSEVTVCLTVVLMGIINT